MNNVVSVVGNKIYKGPQSNQTNQFTIILCL